MSKRSIGVGIGIGISRNHLERPLSAPDGRTGRFLFPEDATAVPALSRSSASPACPETSGQTSRAAIFHA